MTMKPLSDESKGALSKMRPGGSAWSTSTESVTEDSSVPEQSSHFSSSASSKVGRVSVASLGGDSEIKSRIRLSHRESAINPKVESLTMNKLRFSSLGLHGRKEETATLKACFDRLVASRSGQEGSGCSSDSKESTDAHVVWQSSEVVFISGVSGSGKTALAGSIQPLVAKRKGVYISGKFDLYQSAPYFGIIAAFREICAEMLELQIMDNIRYQELCDGILAELGDEIGLLTSIFPILEEAIEIPANSINAVAEQGNKEEKERLKYAFLQFFRVLTRHFKCMVLAFDDLQWADVSSMELLDALIKDKGISIMCIGIYRSNEVDDAHYLSKYIRDLHEAQESSSEVFMLNEISISNLDLTTCEDILSELLSIDPGDKISSLAEICYKRTHGNVFYLVSYLAMLQEDKLLEFNLGTFKWGWDLEAIEANTTVTSNVVELMKRKIEKQPGAVCKLLQLASCLGASFEKDIVVSAFPKLFGDAIDNPPGLEKEITHLLSLAVDEAFLEPQGFSRYRWVHDSVQDAAMHLINHDEMALFQFKLGMVLFQSLSEEELGSNIFVVTNLLNAVECPETDKLSIAELNLKASKRAVEFSAFESCVKFAEWGIALLPANCWSQHEKMSLELYSMCCEAHFSLGNSDKMHFYGDEVMQQRALSELNKVRVYHCKISTLGGSGNASEALALSIKVLGRLGCNFPKTSVGKAVKAISSLSSTKLPDNTEIKDLPPLTDATKKACMVLMINAATYAHYCNDTFAFIMIVARMVRWTTKHGVDGSSASAFALFGLVKVMSGAYEQGNQFAEIGLEIIATLDDKRPESRVTYLAWFLVFPSIKPIHSTLKHLLRGYKVGMEVGDAESAMWNVSTYICGSIVAGKPLKAINADCRIYVEQMRTLKQDQIHAMTLPMWQGVLNLLGDAKDSLLLTGSAMNEDDFLSTIKQSQSYIQLYMHLTIFKSIMCSFFGDFESGAKLAFERGDDYEKKNGGPLVMLDFLHQGISLYAMARKTKEKKYLKAAKKVKSRIQTWAKKGNVNVTHYLPFLNAEEAALEGKSADAIRLYGQTVSLASRSGFQHNAALASERLGEYLLYDVNDNDRAILYFQDAIKYYSEWGSDYKAELLEKKYSYLWTKAITEIIF